MKGWKSCFQSKICIFHLFTFSPFHLFIIFASWIKTTGKKQDIRSDGIQLQRDREEMAAAVGRDEDLPRCGGQGEREVLRAQHVPLPLGGGAARRPPLGIHSVGHIRALQAHEGLQRAQPNGLRRLRTAGRAVRHTDGTAPGRDHRRKHKPLPRAVGQDRILVRLGPRGAHLRPTVLQVDAVGVPENVRVVLRQRPAEGHADSRPRRALRGEGHRGA